MEENKKQRLSDEMRKCRETFERKAREAGRNIEKGANNRYLDEETHLRWQGFFSAWMAVNFEMTPRRHLLEICDKNGKRISEGDVVIGHMGWMPGDGRLPKRFPESVRVLLKVEWDRLTGAYSLNKLGFHPEDEEFGTERNYRQFLYQLEVSYKRLPNGIAVGGHYRRDMVCEDLEIYQGELATVNPAELPKAA